MLRVSRELMHEGIAIASGNEHRPVRGESDVRWKIERPAAVRHLLPCDRGEIVVRNTGIRPLPLDADGLQQLAIGGKLHELLVGTVRNPDEALRVETDGVGKLEHSRSPVRKGGAALAATTNGR